jgi:hypothetical protein
VISYGVRLFGEKLSVDLAFANAVWPGQTLLFPRHSVRRRRVQVLILSSRAASMFADSSESSGGDRPGSPEDWSADESPRTEPQGDLVPHSFADQVAANSAFDNRRHLASSGWSERSAQRRTDSHQCGGGDWPVWGVVRHSTLPTPTAQLRAVGVFRFEISDALREFAKNRVLPYPRRTTLCSMGIEPVARTILVEPFRGIKKLDLGLHLGASTQREQVLVPERAPLRREVPHSAHDMFALEDERRCATPIELHWRKLIDEPPVAVDVELTGAVLRASCFLRHRSTRLMMAVWIS